MKNFDDLLLGALKNYKNKIDEDNLELTKLAESFLDSKIQWDEKRITKMHISLESYSKKKTIPGIYPPKKTKEKGHYPVSFLKSYFRCLLEVYIQCQLSSKPDDKKIIPLIRDELAILDTLIFTILDRERCIQIKNAQHHVQFMKSMLESIKSEKISMPLQYHIGYPGHTYYIVYTKKKGMLRGTIFNAGEGCHLHRTTQENGICKVKPYILEITDIENHLNNLVYWRELFSFVPETELDDATKQYINQSIYSSGKYYGSLNFGENEQKTGNCVSKNYFFAMRARMHDSDFNRIIKKSITVLLAYEIMFNEGMDGIDAEQTHKNLKKSLDSFKHVVDDTQSVYGSEMHLFNPKGKSTDGTSPLEIKSKELEAQRDQIAKMIATTTGIGTALSLCESEEDDNPTWLKLAKCGIVGGLTSVASYYAATNLMDYFDFPAKPKTEENKRIVLAKTTTTTDKPDTTTSSAPPSAPSKKSELTENIHHSFNQSGSKIKEAAKKSIPRSQSFNNFKFS